MATAMRWRSVIALMVVLLGGVACNRPPPAEQGPGNFGPARFPMPQAEFNERISAPLLATCRASEKLYRLQRNACIDLIARRLQACLQAAQAPATIDSLDQFSSLGRLVLDCAKPYPFCSGVEVRTTEQARQHCKPAELPLPPR